MRRVTLGTAGHIDHGKTALVEALTGTNTDRLAEERRRGISIELGYARLDLGDGAEASVVDVPGHERFVRTMVAGATGIDAALICIACDDGVMPQTREHVAILEQLDVKRAVVALTKRDLVDDEGYELARLDALELLATSPLEVTATIGVSVRTGHGLTELRAALRALVTAPSGRIASTRLRLPIDRVFTLRGIGTVATGTLWSGSIASGDRVVLVPAGSEARVRSVQIHDHEVERALAGGRVAVALVGAQRRQLVRGATLAAEPLPPVSYRLDVDLVALHDLTSGSRVEVLHATSAVQARLVLLGSATLPRGEHGFAQLRLVTPIASLRGDRAIIRSLAPPDTVAGAVIVDPKPARHRPGAAATSRLVVLRQGSLGGVAALAADTPTPRGRLVASGLLDPDELAAAVTAAGLLSLGDDWVIAPDAYARIARRAAALVGADTAGDGVPMADIGTTQVVARLEADGVISRRGGRAYAPGRPQEPYAPAARAALLQKLAARPFRPPPLVEAVAELGFSATDARRLLETLEAEQLLVRLPSGLAVTADAYRQAVGLVVEACEAGGRVSLAQLRDATGTSRRYAQALLERMDIDGYTRRVGDHRVLRRRHAGPTPPEEAGA